MKVLALLVFFAVEIVFAGHLLHEQADGDTVRAVVDIPVVGDWYFNFLTLDMGRAAATGDVSAMLTLHKETLKHGRAKDATRAIEQIRLSSSPTARLYVYEFDVQHGHGKTKVVRMSERELLLLHAQVMQENVRPDFRDLTGALFLQQSQRNSIALSEIMLKARNGDADAQWLIGELHTR